MTKKKIMVVDDEPEVLELLENRLKANGYLVVTASNGEEAFHKVKIERPDLIILDILMPQMDGVEFSQKIKNEAHLHPVPIIFVTALQKKSEQKNSGFVSDQVHHRVFAKPFKAEELLEAIKELLAQNA